MPAPYAVALARRPAHHMRWLIGVRPIVDPRPDRERRRIRDQHDWCVDRSPAHSRRQTSSRTQDCRLLQMSWTALQNLRRAGRAQIG